MFFSFVLSLTLPGIENTTRHAGNTKQRGEGESNQSSKEADQDNTETTNKQCNSLPDKTGLSTTPLHPQVTYQCRLSF